ncbi:hypothetical protein Patl1_20666 [Pistacia atlantica]|uniref:Uncharacterized protein n=1 Tax=Pistacia atlantica TaxID=434234 RepID=A0ACC1BHT7_9ROSI|nr:hypothetical protein Patl1_20666 [Pistacia atlantica]
MRLGRGSVRRENLTENAAAACGGEKSENQSVDLLTVVDL